MPLARPRASTVTSRAMAWVCSVSRPVFRAGAMRTLVEEAVATLRFEVVGAEAERDANPVVGATTHHSRPPPPEPSAFGLGERLSLQLPAPDAGIEFSEGPVGCGCSASRRGIRHAKHCGIFRIVPRPSGFEEQDVGAGARQRVGSHSTARAGTDDDNVVRFALQWQRGTAKHLKSAVKDTGKYRPGKPATRPAKHHFCVRPSGYLRAPEMRPKTGNKRDVGPRKTVFLPSEVPHAQPSRACPCNSQVTARTFTASRRLGKR